MIKKTKCLTFEGETWEEVKTKGTKCPKCGEIMIAMIAGSVRNFIMYAYCLKCKKYYQRKEKEA